MAGIGVNLRVTGHCSQGGRKYMEDMFAVAYQQTVDMQDLEYAFCGIFDGHGGPQAAVYAKDHLLDAVVSQRNFWSDNDEDILRAIHDGFIATHYTMWKDVDKWPKTPQGLPSTSGTTATIAFIMKGKIYIGHVGDTCIVLGLQEEGDTEWRAEPLTKDHKPENKQEMTRIQRAGGKVMTKSGVHRVVWNRPQIGHQGPVRRSTPMDEIPFLAVARSLGDFWSYNSQLDQFVVSPEPDVSVFTVDIKRHKCLIFGTDGLWNILSHSTAVSLVQRTESHNEKQNHKMANWLNPSKCLVDRAMEKWKTSNLRADNTSVVVLLLDPPGPPNSNVLINRGNTLIYSTQHSRESPVDDSDEVPRSGGLAIYTHYPNPNVPHNMPSSSSMMHSCDDREESDDDDDEEEDEDLNDDSENDESDNNDDNHDGTNEQSLTEGYSSFVTNFNSIENAAPSPQPVPSPSSSYDPFKSSCSQPAQQCSNQKVAKSCADDRVIDFEAYNVEGFFDTPPRVNRKRSSDNEAVNEECNSSDVENESVFVDGKRRRINNTVNVTKKWDKIFSEKDDDEVSSGEWFLDNHKPSWKKPVKTNSCNYSEGGVSSGEWFLDNHKPSWKTQVKPTSCNNNEDEVSSGEIFVDKKKSSWKKRGKLSLDSSSDTENDTSPSDWFKDTKSRKLSIDKKPAKSSWQKPLPATGKRTLRSDTSAARLVKTLRSRNVDVKSSCDKRDSVMKIISPKRESINTGDLLNREILTKSVKGTQINSGKFRTKKPPPRWSPQTQSTKKCKSTRSQASRNLVK